MKQLNKHIRTCYSSIMSVLLSTMADDRVPRILILLQLRVSTKIMFETMFEQNIRTSMAYQPRNISALNTYGVSMVSESASSPSFLPMFCKAALKVISLFFPSSSYMKNSMHIKTRTMTLNKAIAVLRVYFKIPSLCGKCWFQRTVKALPRCIIQTQWYSGDAAHSIAPSSSLGS